MSNVDVPICKNCQFYKWKLMGIPKCLHPTSKFIDEKFDVVSGKTYSNTYYMACSAQRAYDSKCGPKAKHFFPRGGIL